MRNSLIILMLILSIISRAQKNNIYVNKFTSVNPVSYTDVIFTGTKDTVLVSTYSGRISRIINGENKEENIAKIDDEIYALAYNHRKKEIIASSLTKGILIINERNGKITKNIPLNTSWANNVIFSDNFRYIVAHDQKGRRYIFDLEKNYQNINSYINIPSGRIIKIDINNIVTIVATNKVSQWNLQNSRLINEWDFEFKRFSDMDPEGNFLSIDFNECTKHEALSKSAAFKVKHPNWLLPNIENETEVYEIPFQMQLNAAKFAKNFIYTASIDRSVRVWDKSSGELIKTLSGHKGSISKMKVSENENQVVTVDLKGIIKFWDVK